MKTLERLNFFWQECVSLTSQSGGIIFTIFVRLQWAWTPYWSGLIPFIYPKSVIFSWGNWLFFAYCVLFPCERRARRVSRKYFLNLLKHVIHNFQSVWRHRSEIGFVPVKGTLPYTCSKLYFWVQINLKNCRNFCIVLCRTNELRLTGVS
jgi:hypothetical protein